VRQEVSGQWWELSSLSAYQVDVQFVGKEEDELRTYKLEEENRFREMIFWPVIFFVGIVVILILWKPTGRTELWTEMSAEEKYMLAKKIFTRDPSNFKDLNNNKIDDQVDS